MNDSAVAGGGDDSGQTTISLRVFLTAIDRTIAAADDSSTRSARPTVFVPPRPRRDLRRHRPWRARLAETHATSSPDPYSP